MTRDEQERLAAEHVLGLLEGEERGQAERLLATDATFQAMVEEWRSRFSEWDSTAAALPPGDALWQRIEAGLAAEPARATQRPLAAAPLSSPSGPLRSLWDNLAFWRAFGLAGALAALLLAMGMGFFALKASRQPILVAVLMNDANQPGAVLRTFADGRVELTPLGDMQIPHNHSIQVWTFPDPACGTGLGRNRPCGENGFPRPAQPSAAAHRSTVRDIRRTPLRIADGPSHRSRHHEGNCNDGPVTVPYL